MNKVILMGRLTRDPDVRYSAGGGDQQAYARYTIAVDRRVFGRSAQFAEQYLRKGTKVVVTGRIQTGKYTNKDGQTVFTTDVVVEDQEFAESKAASDRYNGSQGAAPSAPAPSYAAPAPAQAAPAPVSGSADGDFINIPEGLDEELPFK